MSDLYNKLKENTTSDAIAYAPGSLLGTNPSDVIIPGVTAEWDLFSDRRKNRKKKMREAIDLKVQQIQIDIANVLDRKIKESKLTYNQYIHNFGYTKDITPPNVLIGLGRSKQDLEKIKGQLSDDVGELELIFSTVQNSKPLNKFEIFSDYDYLFGCRLQSTPVKTVTFIYEGFQDQNGVERESLTIGDPDIVEALKRRGIKNKISDNGKWARVYPFDRYFDTVFYNIIKEVLSSDFDEQDENDLTTEDDDGNIS